MPSKQAFLAALREELKTYPWARGSRIDNAMSLYQQTIETTENLVAINGPAVLAAWRAIGGKGRPTYKALRELV